MVTKPRASSGETDSAEVIIQNPARLRAATVTEIHSWLDDLLAELCPGANFAVRFDTDRSVAAANERWRNIAGPTDVLSFPGENSIEDHPHLGDVLIAVPTARRQAKRQGHSLLRELKILLLHGALHCLGYDHEVDDGAMERVEQRLRRKWITEGDDRVGGEVS